MIGRTKRFILILSTISRRKYHLYTHTYTYLSFILISIRITGHVRECNGDVTEISPPSLVLLPLVQFLAKLTTSLAKPRGVRVLRRRDVTQLLSTTPATKIHGCGEGSTAAKQFASWGVRSVLDLRRFGASELRARLGEHIGAKVRARLGEATFRLGGGGGARRWRRELTYYQ